MTRENDRDTAREILKLELLIHLYQMVEDDDSRQGHKAISSLARPCRPQGSIEGFGYDKNNKNATEAD